jgi:hypothetical protein
MKPVIFVVLGTARNDLAKIDANKQQNHFSVTVEGLSYHAFSPAFSITRTFLVISLDAVLPRRHDNSFLSA